MTNYQAPRKTAPQKAIMRRRANRGMTLWKRRLGYRFRKLMLDRKRYWAARRKMQQARDLTLGDARIRVFLDELRAA